MPRVLTLSVPRFVDKYHWTWRLADESGAVLAEHDVQIAEDSAEYADALNVYEFLRLRVAPDRREEDERRLTQDIGRWIGREMLGPAICDALVTPNVPLTVRLLVPLEPADALKLAQCPFPLAWAGNDTLARRDITFVVDLERASVLPQVRDAAGPLRVLALFSMPTRVNPLGVRQERIALQRLFERLATNRAVELRVVQFGTTRESLKALLKQGPGWDIVHISGHGRVGTLVLEHEDGTPDEVPAGELIKAFWNQRDRLKWITLSSCESGAEMLAETRRWVGLEDDRAAMLVEETDRAAATDETRAPGVARSIISKLDCAVVAMRYPVEDRFATEFASRLYESAIGDGNSLPRAVQYAVQDAIKASTRPELAQVTPALFGRRAATLTLTAPVGMPVRSRIFGIEPPAYFVGRSEVMTSASSAFSPGSRMAGVLFLGMAGVGKSSCANELADLQLGVNRFERLVFYKAPNENVDTSGVLASLCDVWDRTSGDEVKLVGLQSTDAATCAETLELLKATLARRAILVVLDNCESLLGVDGTWRNPRLGALVAAMLSHDGLSRVVLTSRRRPAFTDKERAQLRLLELPVNALSLTESLLLARQLPNLGRLLAGTTATPEERTAGRALVKRVLRRFQGHPKLIHMAESLASDASLLRTLLDEPPGTEPELGPSLDAFFRTGTAAQDASTKYFEDTIKDWTNGVLTALTVDAKRLFVFLCCLDDADRQQSVVDRFWPTAWYFLEQQPPAPVVTPLLDDLARLGLIERRNSADDDFVIHPAVAEAGVEAIDAPARTAIEHALARGWKSQYEQARDSENAAAAAGLSATIVEQGLKAAAYLVRLQHWSDAADVIEEVRYRDESPVVNQQLIAYMDRVTAESAARYVRNSRIYASVLLNARHYAEAETILTKAAMRAKQDGQFREASVALDELFELLHTRGQIAEAEECLLDMKQCTAAARLGPWSRIVDDTWSMLLLHDKGLDAEALQAFDTDLYPRVKALPEWSADLSMQAVRDGTGAEDPANSWTARELLLDVARRSAIGLGQWERAHDLSSKALLSQRQRGAPALEVAEVQLYEAQALVGLGRLHEAEQLLGECRERFEQEEATRLIGESFAVVAALDAARRDFAKAASGEAAALRYRYSEELPAPFSCAQGHAQLSAYIAQSGVDPGGAAAHRAAAALIRYQLWAGGKKNWLEGEDQQRLIGLIADVPAPEYVGGLPLPADFAALCSLVERTPGIQFRRLFKMLPNRLDLSGNAVYRQMRATLVERTVPGQSPPAAGV